MYNEQADLLEKLDIQIHELYEYYTLRPVLHSLASCDKVLRAIDIIVLYVDYCRFIELLLLPVISYPSFQSYLPSFITLSLLPSLDIVFMFLVSDVIELFYLDILPVDLWYLG